MSKRGSFVFLKNIEAQWLEKKTEISKLKQSTIILNISLIHIHIRIFCLWNLLFQAISAINLCSYVKNLSYREINLNQLCSQHFCTKINQSNGAFNSSFLASTSSFVLSVADTYPIHKKGKRVFLLIFLLQLNKFS